MEPQNKSRNYILPASILIAAVLISGSLIYAVGVWNSNQNKKTGLANKQFLANVGQNINLEASSRDVILGEPKAPVTLIEYGDYQCPFCARFFNQTEPNIRENYIKTGKVKMVFRNFIVNDRTPEEHESHWSAEAAECAKDQNQFWNFHNALFAAESKDGQENNGNLNRDLFLKLAAGLKMDVNKFTSCFDGHTYSAAIQAESDAAAQIGVAATPTVFINNQKVEGAYPYDYFKQAIDSELQKG